MTTASINRVKVKPIKTDTFFVKVKRDFIKNFDLYLLVIPVLIFYIIFHYKPMYGLIIAFKNFVPNLGIADSPWVGLQHFTDFFQSPFFGRTLRNTLVISGCSIVFGFPAPILLALLMNELKNKYFSRTVQTITYLPHFISLVVLCGMIKIFTADTGVIGAFVSQFTNETGNLLNYPSNFVPIYIFSNIWQEVGWGSIIYLAALAGIDQQLYEAAKIDGAGKWKQTIHITIPGITHIIVIMLILRLGNIINVGFEKIILLYNDATREAADVISSFVYRKGLQEFNFGYSAAVGMFNSVINFAFLISANLISKKFNGNSLW